MTIRVAAYQATPKNFINERIEQTLQEAFEPFKDAFVAQGLELHLLVIQP